MIDSKDIDGLYMNKLENIEYNKEKIMAELTFCQILEKFEDQDLIYQFLCQSKRDKQMTNSGQYSYPQVIKCIYAYCIILFYHLQYKKQCLQYLPQRLIIALADNQINIQKR
eukprot:TRINITY_DN112_c2_g1_i1.p3 TRINITY_DN112_c2_g1~~TRINITY_DN112_c2_g1_i1.p3  ORF type:complete len:112 (-),score=7.07 TRINITY_DN112_c2_g1_i1:116-451(-)